MTVKRNIRLILAFEGTAYHGWQIQRNLPTIQGILTELLAKITRERVALIGCGRTDAGTHAREYVANFLMGSSIPPPRLVRALNGMLPRDIRILSARRVAGEFHPWASITLADPHDSKFTAIRSTWDRSWHLIGYVSIFIIRIRLTSIKCSELPGCS